jgi:hypothetical protein
MYVKTPCLTILPRDVTDKVHFCRNRQSITKYARNYFCTGWTIGILGFDSRRGLGIILFTTASRTALGPTQPPTQWVRGALSLGVKRPGREADHSPPSSAIYTFTTWCSVKKTAQWQLYLYLNIWRSSRGGSVGILTRLGDGRQGFDSRRGQELFSLRHRVHTD